MMSYIHRLASNKYFLKCATSNCYIQRYFVKFRDKFVSPLPYAKITSWYPGHMYRGMLQLQAKLAVVDCIIEVHDARVPFTGRNPKFYSMLGAIRPHILVLNKKDLADMAYEKEITRRVEAGNIHNVIFTNCKENKGSFQKIIPTAVELIKNSDLYNRANRTSFLVMVVGIPNVGKSSVINRLRNFYLNKKNASNVGAVPGITKNVLEKIKVSQNPLIYLLDSPGIIQPNIENLEDGLKLAVCRTVSDNVVAPELIADYLLYWLNKHKNFTYLEYLDLKEPIDDIRQLIIHIATQLNKVKKVRNAEGRTVEVPHVEESSMHFLTAFRKGLFGRVMLDADHLQNVT